MSLFRKLPLGHFFVCMAVYMLGASGFSWTAFIIGLVFVKSIQVWGKVADLNDRNRFRRLKRVAQNEKEVVAEFKNLGASWIEFPDKDRVEWINSIFPLLWRHIDAYVEEILRCDVEKQVRSVSHLLRNFSFGTITLGKSTPRIDGIRTYENTANEIVIDIDIFYAGDLAVTLKITPGMQVGVSNVMFRGSLRVILSPLLSEPPFIGAVTLFFLKTPLIDLDTKGALLNLPGVESTIENVIMDEITKVMVQPHRIVVPLDPKVDVDALMSPMPVAVLRLGLVKGINLSACDRGNKSDPYCVIETSGYKIQSQVIKGTVNPVWNEGFTIPISSMLTGNLELSFYDWDMSSKNDPMGKLTLGLDSISSQPKTQDIFMLQEVERGEVEIHWEWLQLTRRTKLMDKAKEQRDTFFNTFNNSKMKPCAIVNCIIKSAETFPKLKQASPSIQASLEVRNQIQKTRICEHSCEPTWKQGFYFFLEDPMLESIRITFRDIDHGEKILGTTRVNLAEVYNAPECFVERSYPVNQCINPAATVLLNTTIRLTIPGELIPDEKLAARVIVNIGMTYDKETGTLEIFPNSAKTLDIPPIPEHEKVKDMLIRIKPSGNQTKKLETTPADDGQLHPCWTDIFTIKIPPKLISSSSLSIEAVCTIMKKEIKLGRTTIPLAQMANSSNRKVVKDFALT